ncbi:FAD-dependent oxidoreductase [uncultured Flavobacterium sp.]|uniref:NAD(P)/FAD-dependent oxidoreductase n=1 Tax=uncultured Flavobacterium sp. TaxID=165435 RepID=UPI0030C7EEA0
MKTKDEISIIGGGLAGLIAAIDLSKRNFNVLLFEKNDYPKHKVCGEFISNEVLPYLKYLDLAIESLNPTKININQLSTHSGKTIESDLPLGGFGISRFALDNYLYNTFLELGGKVVKEVVTKVGFFTDDFTVFTQNNDIYTSKIVLGAFGKRSNLDMQGLGKEDTSQFWTKDCEFWLKMNKY